MTGKQIVGALEKYNVCIDEHGILKGRGQEGEWLDCPASDIEVFIVENLCYIPRFSIGDGLEHLSIFLGQITITNVKYFNRNVGTVDLADHFESSCSHLRLAVPYTNYNAITLKRTQKSTSALESRLYPGE